MVVMQVCVLIDLIIALSMGAIGVGFLKSDGGACRFLSGYNMKSPEERAQYDEARMCRDYGRVITRWALFFVLGAMADLFVPFWGISCAFGLFFITLIVHIVSCRNDFQRWKKP
jgi:hypothetical protein